MICIQPDKAAVKASRTVKIAYFRIYSSLHPFLVFRIKAAGPLFHGEEGKPENGVLKLFILIGNKGVQVRNTEGLNPAPMVEKEYQPKGEPKYTGYAAEYSQYKAP